MVAAASSAECVEQEVSTLMQRKVEQLKKEGRDRRIGGGERPCSKAVARNFEFFSGNYMISKLAICVHAFHKVRATPLVCCVSFTIVLE